MCNKASFRALFFCLLFACPLFAQINQLPNELVSVGVEEHIGTMLDFEVPFTNQENHSVKLGDYFKNDKPVILALMYYNCPRLCHLVADGMESALKMSPLKSGLDYNVLSISIDPNDSLESARNFQQKYTGTIQPWDFLIGNKASIDSVSDALGFNYTYNVKTGEYAHSAVVFVITPEGKIARYLYGISFDALDVKLSLIEAKKENLQNTIERVLLFCYNYDPDTRGYVLQAWRLMRVGGAITLLLLIVFVIVLIRKNKYLKDSEHD